MAGDERVPLLERLRFTAIFSSNLDEFCMVRVAELLEAVRTSPNRPRTAGDLLPSEVLDRVGTRMRELVERQSAMLGELLAELRAAGIAIMPVSEVMPSERGELAAMFHGSIFPVLTPLAVGPGRPFPYISNLSLSLGVMLRDPETGQRRLARVKVPEVLPRFLPIGDDGDRFVTLEDLIATHLDSLFPGMEIEEHAAFRVTRDADFEIEEAADDLLSAVERELRRRRFGEVVRVELANSMSAGMRHQLLAHLHADEAYVYAVDGLLDLADLVELTQIERPELRYPEWQGVTRPRLRGDGDAPADLFAAIREGDIFVEHPYDAFSTSVERLFEQAVDDPDVLAIKHTIYRTSGDSPMVPALIRAAEQGKQAVVLVELKARFDEARNIGWARALERAGVHVVHGFPALKTHAKCALVVRREHGGIRRYVHIGTGNYHPRTARLYTDAGLFTCRPDIAADVSDLFNYLTGFGRPQRYRKLLVAPTDLRERIIDEVRRVTADTVAGGRGRIVLKMNGLADRPVIESLYEASQAGVQVDLVVRSICCLRPGVPDLSENIRVVSVLGRFLEHERLFAFHGAESRYFLGSADMMPRNLDSRVEVLVPVEDTAIQGEIDTLLETSLSDTRSCFQLMPDGTWERRRPAEGERRALLARRAHGSRAGGRARRRRGRRSRGGRRAHRARGQAARRGSRVSSRYAVIDVGTNTVRLLVAEQERRPPHSDVTPTRSCVRLGRDLRATARISDQSLLHVSEALRSYSGVARKLGAVDLRIIATSAAREAENGQELAARVLADTGHELEIIDEDEEARLAWVGALNALDEPWEGEVGVVDVGGGSTEVVVGSIGNGIHFSHSYKLGSGRLTDMCIEHDPPRPFELERVRRIIDETLPAMGEIPQPQHASAVAGSASNLRRLVGPLLDVEALERAVRILCEHPSRRVARRFELEQERVRILPAGALILHACAVRLGVPLWFCKGGIREGAVLDMVAARLDRPAG